VRAGVTPYRAVGPAAAGGLLDYFRARFEAPRVVETILGAGWADRAALDAALAEIPAWAAQPAATFIEESPRRVPGATGAAPRFAPRALKSASGGLR
jgi:hypothetical protein